MKKLLLALLFATPFVARSQVTVSTSQYTSQELVNSVLLNNGFVPATNITSVTGTNFNSVSGLGYFQKNDSGFQFENGIILSTGDAINANGPAIDPVTSSGSSEWVGDADINTIINNSGSNLPSNNATALEFDFTALQDYFSLDYIFASNEYGIYQCSYGDVIAILLKDITSDTPYTNLAVVPGTNTLVSVATIRDVAYNPACQSINSEYFGYYYPDFAATAPISFRGATIPLRAEASVIPGHIYHMKLVIADKTDSAFDSAIFIEAGSLKYGNLTPDEAAIKSNIGTVLCDGFTAELTVPNNNMFTYEWTYNSNVINNSTNTLNASQAGEYRVTISLPDTDYSITSAITLTTGGGISELNNVDDLTISEPNSDGIAEFDFSPVMDQLGEIFQGNGNYTTTFHETLNDAETGANPLNYAYSNITNPQTVYARIENGNGCAVITDISLIVQQEIVPITLPVIPPYGICEYNTDGQSIFDLNDILSPLLSNYYNNDYTISIYHSQYNAQNNVGAIEDPSNYTGGNETLYIKVTDIANPSNYSIASFDLIVENGPNMVTGVTYAKCEESLPNDGISVFDLTMMDDQFKGMCSSCSVQYYLTQMDAENSINPIENPYTFTNTSNNQVLYVNVKSYGPLGCSAISTLSIVVNPLPEVSSVPDQYFIDNDETPDNNFTIDLNFFQNIIIGDNPSQDLTITYYESESDAIDGINAIVDTQSYTATTQTLYFRAKTNSNCAIIQSFNITILASDYETPVPNGETEQTFTTGQTLADLIVDGENIVWYSTSGTDTFRGPEETPLPLSTTLVDGVTYYASQTVNGIESTDRLAVTVHFVLDINDVAFTGLQYYPNPVTDRLSIKNTTNIDTISIINTLGQTIINNRFDNTEGEINFSNLSSGIYFLRLSAEGKTKTLKITKN